ncbi:MAG: hypothetical protein A2075_09000 [Geobacteraceae bacterium GWC2_58_44]|nr:MAG: hypothetical protein A2075_09000 [Geobacteraceae bacterium GWC2_58_44]HBG04061.1 hypothetical protein [Geobacter sp.]
MEFRGLCAGKHPATGERIVAPKLVRDRKTGKLVEVHRAGNWNRTVFQDQKSLGRLGYPHGTGC